jgi:uncharacterized protein YjbJ (UPF0337 family)
MSGMETKIQEEPIMGDRIDEIKGQAKQTVGGLTGNEDMEREGEAEETAAKMHREAEGIADQAEGKGKEVVGEVTDDEQTEAEGELQQKKGDLERAG